ncbi:MAG: DEAD/DEAH box helicase family protein [Flavobacterium sp.]
MELPNTHFLDFLIEFKEINPSDFKHKDRFGIGANGFEVADKIIIEPNDNGFINEALQSHIELDHKNTVVINAPVGYGKSFAIIKTIERIYNEIPNSVIVVATPFVSLVQQYVDDIGKGTRIPLEQIYDYTDLGRNPQTPYLNKRVQVVTVNTLLGNPGEDGFKNSDKKRRYLDELVSDCNSSGKKVYFIYDEIHDAIQNFKEEFMFNLWKWRDVIKKNFIISATFNEASKVVIEYLAELTDRKIQIIESIRKRFPEKQSTLHLHYSAEYNFTHTTKELVKLVDRLLSENKNIDILSYSKTLAKSIIQDNSGIGKKLSDRFGELNDCTSQLVSNQRPENETAKNRYHNEKCNVGTNFKTGVSIKKKRHAFIIILPPRSTRLWFRNRYGIFSGGINSIIQALARQRTKGEIHIILPKPDRFEYRSLAYANFTAEQVKVFQQMYDLVHHHEDDEKKLIKYLPLVIQDLLTLDFYTESLKGDVKKEINHVENLARETLTRLEFPSYDLFKLRRGEEFLANTYKFYGEDISAYLTYCAFTNQFINCDLVELNHKTTLFFEAGKIQESLNYNFNKYFGEDYYNSYLSFSNFNMFYQNVRNRFFEEFTLRYKTPTKSSNISPFKNKDFEGQLLRFCGIMFYLNNYFYTEDFENRNVDIEYTRSTYFLDCIAIANTINLETVNYSEDYKNKIKAYKNLSYFREKLSTNIIHSTRSNVPDYLPLKPSSNFFNADELLKMDETISLLVAHDDFIKNDLFNFGRNVTGKTHPQKATSFYAMLLEDFFETSIPQRDRRVAIDGITQRVKTITNTKPLPPASGIIDLIHPADYNSDYMNYIESSVSELGFESFERYQESIDSLLAQVQAQS